jgi:hypothetical protein
MKLAILVLLGFVSLSEARRMPVRGKAKYGRKSLNPFKVSHRDTKKLMKEFEMDLVNFEEEESDEDSSDSDSETCDPNHAADTCDEIKDGGACIAFTLKAGGN